MRYSYSALRTWLTCPRQFEARYVTKTMPFVETAATKRGKEIHNALEKCVAGEGEIPPSVWLPDGLMDVLVAGQARPEHKIELEKPHFIGYLDVYMPASSTALVIDWKTGKMKSPDPLQADVYAWLVREELGIPDLEVKFAWVGVDCRRVQTCEPDVRAKDRVLDVIDSIEKTWGNWPAVENWLCRYCPLEWCENNAAS